MRVAERDFPIALWGWWVSRFVSFWGVRGQER
jgi:hypothetical protein